MAYRPKQKPGSENVTPCYLRYQTNRREKVTEKATKLEFLRHPHSIRKVEDYFQGQPLRLLRGFSKVMASDRIDRLFRAYPVVIQNNIAILNFHNKILSGA